MNIIKVTQLTKKRVKDMIADLMPEYKYVRVRNSGVVMLKKRWWSFKYTTVNVTDLFIDTFPKLIVECCKRKGYGDGYSVLFSDNLYVLLRLRAYKKDVDLVGYVWQQYNKLIREVPKLSVIVSSAVIEDPSSRYTPVLSPVSNRYIPGVEILLRRNKKNDSVENLVEKITKIKSRVPKVLVTIQRLRAA